MNGQHAAHRPRVIIVASRQRSSSTRLADLLAKPSPIGASGACPLHVHGFGEPFLRQWKGDSGGAFARLEEHLLERSNVSHAAYAARFARPLEFALALADGACRKEHPVECAEPARCSCAVVLKAFDIHLQGSRRPGATAPREFARLLAHPASRVLVLERSAAEEACSFAWGASYKRAQHEQHAQAGFTFAPTRTEDEAQSYARFRRSCCAAPERLGCAEGTWNRAWFATELAAHRRWFDWVRATLRRGAAPHTEVRYEDVVRNATATATAARDFAAACTLARAVTGSRPADLFEREVSGEAGESAAPAASGSRGAGGSGRGKKKNRKRFDGTKKKRSERAQGAGGE